MDRQIINKRIEGIQNDIEKLVRTLRAMESIDISQYPENYELLSTDAALRSELITCRLRNLIFGTAGIKRQNILLRQVLFRALRSNARMIFWR